MSIYTVFQPPLRGEDISADPERFAFVREGFHFWAMIFAPLWLLSHLLWLAFVGYLVLVPLLTFGTYWLTRSDDAATVVGFAVALLMGFEASTLRRWTLERNGWRNLGSVVADDIESAEQRFFESWVAGGGLAPVVAQVATQPAMPHAMASGSDDVIGLFPGASR